jgi:hypothetical protein
MGLFWKDVKRRNEEKATDKKLSTLALRKGVNQKAAS